MMYALARTDFHVESKKKDWIKPSISNLAPSIISARLANPMEWLKPFLLHEDNPAGLSSGYDPRVTEPDNRNQVSFPGPITPLHSVGSFSDPIWSLVGAGAPPFPRDPAVQRPP